MSDQQSSDAVADVYEVDSIKIRAEARKAARKVELAKKEAEEELKRHLMARALRARSRPAPVAAPSVWARIYSGFVRFIKSKVLHQVLAFSSLAIVAGGVGFWSYNLILERIAIAFRDHCLENHMKYAIGSGGMYCYDDRRFAHMITDAGVTGRLVADWRVNEHQLRLAEKAAERATGPFAKPVVQPAASLAAIPVTAPAPALTAALSAGTVAELAAQLMGN